jgi:uncharacterized protein
MSDLICPNDGTALRGIDRSGVHVDACPTCRGIWLDRGELDKIVDRERADLDDFEQEIRGEPDRDRGSYDVGHAKPHKKKKRSSFLEEFLDFGG